jgi:membrane protease YdiL (CAAX protease family)
MLFRGLVQNGLAERFGLPFGPWIGLLVASAVFGLAHMISTTYALVAMVIGIYLGLLLVVTDSIATPIVAHGLYDFVALLYLLRRR